MEFDAVFTVKKEIEKETFKRELLIKLGKHKDTPIDIVNIKIGEVRECIKEVMVCTAFVSGTCTSSIGYDREEPYTDYETYKEKIGDTYVKRQRAVTKYRTVTDWRPFNTDFSGKATYAVDNIDEVRSYRGNATHALKTISNSSIVEKGDAVINRNALSRAISECELDVKIYNVKLPGDKQKDTRYQCSSDIESVNCYKLPYYEVSFDYEGKEYSASGFACGDLSVHYDVPVKEKEANTNPEVDVELEAKQMTEELDKNTKMAWKVFFGILAFGAVVCFILKFCWIWPVSVVALICACIINKKYNVEYNSCVNMLALNYAKMKSQEQATRMRAKIDALNKALTSHGYNVLSDSETPVIDGESDSVVEKNIPKTAPPKSFKKKTIICAVLTIALMISSFAVNNKELHSPKQIEVNIVDKVVEYDPDKYINGCYYIYLDFELEAKKKSVDYVELKVFIKDKDGNDLGGMRATLSGMTVEAGDTKTVTISLSENQPEKNEFFSTLYDAEFDDLKFEYEIGSIHFDDGEYYYIKDYENWMFK